MSAETSEQETLQRLSQQLRQAQKLEALGRLVGGVAHDFNNLLTAINGYSELILLQMKPDDPQHSAVEEIRAAGLRAADLTRRLLALSRQQATAPRKTDLNRIVAELEKLLRRVLGEDVELTLKLGGGLGAIYIDPRELEQVLLNLAIHARQSLPTGGRLTLETKARPAGAEQAPDGCSRLIVDAAGPSFGEARESAGDEPTEPGLALVYDIVREAGGQMEKTVPDSGPGLTARIDFPMLALDSPEGPGANVHGLASLPRGHETILLAEDEGSVRSLVRRILERQGYRVFAAPDAKTALELCDSSECRPHLLLTDVVMPERDGLALAEDLRARIPELKILFMSGYPDTHNGIRRLSREQAAFLPKPFSPAVLAQRVRKVLDTGG